MVWRIAPVLLLAGTVTAAAAPLVPPSDQAGRERYRFTPSPLDRFMEPNPPAKPLLRWDCDARRSGRAQVEDTANTRLLTRMATRAGRFEIYAASFSRRTSGATASSTSALSATSSGSTLWPSLPRRRIETVRSAASFRPTTSRAGTLASECSRTL